MDALSGIEFEFATCTDMLASRAAHHINLAAPSIQLASRAFNYWSDWVAVSAQNCRCRMSEPSEAENESKRHKVGVFL
jgi:hypothetical protein